MLTECLGGGPDAAVARVTADYDVDEGVRPRRDVGDLLAESREPRADAGSECGRRSGASRTGAVAGWVGLHDVGFRYPRSGGRCCRV